MIVWIEKVSSPPSAEMTAAAIAPTDLERARNQVVVRHLQASERPARRLEQAALDLYALRRVRGRDERIGRVERQPRENAERLQAKAEAKLADLPAQTRLTDPAAIDRKRAVIEAALARARAQRPT